MKVKALCTIKDENGTHAAGEIFETDADLGNLAEIIEEPEAAEDQAVEPEKPKASRRKKA